MAGKTPNERPTIADVAERASVSIATVSRVINNTGQVAEDTRDRVNKAIQELKYMPHAAARGLASRKTHTIGLIVDAISGPFFQPMLRGIEAAAREQGYDLLINTVGDGRRGYPLGKHNTDGLLVFTDSLDTAEIRRMHQEDFPLVLLFRSSPPGIHVPHVDIENRHSTRHLIDHVIENCGRRRIAFISGPENNEASYWRDIGYREALKAHGIPFDETLTMPGNFREYRAREAMDELLNKGADIDAVFAGTDDAALGVLAALREHKLRIPEDVAVVGFDDIPISRHLTPGLTTVASPIETAGHEAVQRLIEFIQTGETRLSTLLSAHVVVRESCGYALG